MPHHDRDVSRQGLAQALVATVWRALLGLTPIPVGNIGIDENQWPELVGPAIRSLEGAVTVDRLEAPPGWRILVPHREVLAEIEDGEVAERTRESCIKALRAILASDQSRSSLCRDFGRLGRG